MMETDDVANLEFKWGKKKGVGGKKKEVQFYSSFTYDGVDYNLYDCVYMHREGGPEPYVGKLIKIWENGDKTKKVKVQWFFRPSEISHWLGNISVMENEIFLGSGEGVGLAHVNPLEAIAGKCNVVCTSKDSRNQQPSEEELEVADYIFYRTFDVGICTIMDITSDKVGGTEVKFVFNTKDSVNSCAVPKCVPDGKGKDKYALASNGKEHISVNTAPDEYNSVMLNGDNNQFLAASDDVTVKCEYLTDVKPASPPAPKFDTSATITGKLAHPLGKVVTGSEDGSVKAECNDIEVKAEKRPQSASYIGDLDERPIKKAKMNNSSKSSVGGNSNSAQKLIVRGNDVRCDPIGQEREVSLDEEKEVENKHFKRTKLEYPCKDKNSNIEKVIANTESNFGKSLTASGSFHGERTKSKVAKDSFGPNDIWNGEKINTKAKGPSIGKLLKRPSLDLGYEDRETEAKIFDVTARPNAENSKWFKESLFEDKVQNAEKDGTILLLHNLDPEYVSSEVEDIMWHAFKEHCSAKMVQHTSISSPQSGQAIVIFKTKEGIERVARRLTERCLMLPNGRPLVCSRPPSFTAKQSTYYGHLVIDNKIQAQRDKKDAVSTSHCSQPNTIEYFMAMEWCLLQSRSDSWWKSLHKQQEQELRKLKATFKSK